MGLGNENDAAEKSAAMHFVEDFIDLCQRARFDVTF
jgi:hypothetical protein